MKVIFLPNNTASLMTSTIPRLKSLGIDAIGFNFAPKVFQNKDSVVNLPPDLIGRLTFLVSFFYHLATADVVHWIYGSGSKMALFILYLVGIFKKHKFVEFCGTDVRSLEKMCQDISFYRPDEFSDQLCFDLGTSVTSDRTQQRFSFLGFKAMPNSPELMDYLETQYYKEYFLISRSVSLEKLPYVKEEIQRQVPMVSHMPSNPEVKGTKFVIEACEKLKDRGLINFRLITGVPHEEALKLLKESDIVIDQLIIGEYGVLSIEAMALGKPVISFLRPKVEKYYQDYFEDCPIVNASILNLEAVLEDLVRDKARRKDLGARGRRYVERYHDAQKNAVNLNLLYQGEVSTQSGTL